MPLAIKELVVVLGIATVVFTLASPILKRFSIDLDLRNRKIAWFSLTVAGFLSPNFWIYLLFAIPLQRWIARRDSNPSAVYLMLLHVLPPISIRVPMVGLSYLFVLDNYLLLAFCVVTPAALKLLNNKSMQRVRLDRTDYLLLTYGVLTSFFYILPQAPDGSLFPATVTECIRRLFVFCFETYIPYFLISRSNADSRVIADTLSAYCMGCALMVGVACFESARHWLIYEDIAVRWGLAPAFTSYLSRGGSLRAFASSGQPLALGYLIAVAFGFWLYLKDFVESRSARTAVTIFLWLGLMAAYSRGPWIGAVFIYFAFAALSPHGVAKLTRAIAVTILTILGILVTPLGAKVISVIPFFGGTVDNGTIEYRNLLLRRSWDVIQKSPWFGDPLALLKMQDLRQGQGIIDLVNAYIEILLSNGFVGFFCFLSFVLGAFFSMRVGRLQPGQPNSDIARLGASIGACILGTLVFFAGGGLGIGVERMFYVLVALAVAYSRLVRSNNSPPSAVGFQSLGSNQPSLT